MFQAWHGAPQSEIIVQVLGGCGGFTSREGVHSDLLHVRPGLRQYTWEEWLDMIHTSKPSCVNTYPHFVYNPILFIFIPKYIYIRMCIVYIYI